MLIYGATGQTGRAVVEALAHAGSPPVPLVLAGRNEAALRRVAAALPGVHELRVAPADAGPALCAAMDGCGLVLQCAALPEASVHAIVGAAISAGLSYIDVAAERDKVEALARRHDREARRQGVAVCCGVAPIGGALGEWLGLAAARRALAGREPSALTELTIAYASDALPPSLGSWASSLTMLGQRPTGGWGLRRLEFPPPFGRLAAFSFALGGSAALEVRYPAAAHRTYAAFSLPRPTGAGVGARDRPPRIAAVAHARAGDRWASLGFSGVAPYLMTARMVALVAETLRSGTGPTGVVTASELMGPPRALAALEGLGRLFVGDP